MNIRVNGVLILTRSGQDAAKPIVADLVRLFGPGVARIEEGVCVLNLARDLSLQEEQTLYTMVNSIGMHAQRGEAIRLEVDKQTRPWFVGPDAQRIALARRAHHLRLAQQELVKAGLDLGEAMARITEIRLAMAERDREREVRHVA